MGVGLGNVDDFEPFGDETDPGARARILDRGLDRLTGYWDGGFQPLLERLLNRMVLTLLTIGLGGISVALLTSEGGPEVAGIQARIFDLFGWATAAFATLLLLRILLAVLRSDRDLERG